MILVLAHVNLRDGCLDEALALSREHVRRSRAEPGCLAHAVHRDDEHPLRLVFVERWATPEALWAHFAVPASRDFARRLEALAAERSTLEIFGAEPVAPPKPPAAKPPAAKSSKAKPAAAKAAEANPAGALIDARIAELGDWRGAMLARLRALILASDPGIVEEWKWGGPVWSAGGLICTGETYKQVVKLTFARGASVPDPSGLFNSSLEGKVRRAIDFRQGDEPDAQAFQALVRAAAAINRS